MIPGEVYGWRDLVGTYIRTGRSRFPRVRFGKFGIATYELAAGQQVPWPAGLLEAGVGCEDQPRFGHPLTILLLQRAKQRLVSLTGKTAGAFTSNGFYRPPGLTWGLGKYGDPDGVIDSTDEWGHWRLAIDIGRSASALSFGVDKATLMEVLASVGFSRPFLNDGEGWHFRPNAEQRAKWAARGLA